MTITVDKHDKRGNIDVQAVVQSLVLDPTGIASAIAECARARISSPADLRTKARAILNAALESSPPTCKTLAVFSRRLHDRYPRFKADNGGCVTLASVMFHTCQAELSSLHESAQQLCEGISNENALDEGNSQRQHQSASDSGGTTHITMQEKPDECTSEAPATECLKHLRTLQIFVACLYTQDVVPEEFVHKILDSYRFSSLSWPAPARNVGIMSACDMMMFCGKRLEKLGSLCHVMPDWYSYLRSLQHDLSIPREVHERIAFVVNLREKNWVPEATVTE